MKERKNHHLRIRITEEQSKNLFNYISEHPQDFKNKSQFIRESIKEKISRNKPTLSSKLRSK